MFEFIPAGSTWLPVTALGAIAAAIVSCVAAWRKWKSGEIEDDGILLQRLLAELHRKDLEIDRKNASIKELDDEIDSLRKRFRRVEDVASVYRRQLIENKIQPEEVPS